MGGDDERRRRVVLTVGALGAAGVAVAVVLVVTRGAAPSTQRSSSAPPHTPPTSTAALAPTPTPAPGPPARPAPSREQFGTGVNRLFNGRGYGLAQIVDLQLARLRRTGATIARSDALWETTEPQPPVGGVHRYDWAFDDLVAASLASHGLQWLPIIDYSPRWAQSARGTGHSPPRRASDYASYAGALAARYGAGGAFWRTHPGLTAKPVDTYEVWNEPDSPTFFSPAPDAARYAELYLRARDAIAAAQPGSRVIVGGLTNAHAFLPAMFAARPDLRGHVDGIGIHPYDPTPAMVLARVRTTRQLLRSLGMATVPLYLTEFGWTIHPAGALNWLPERLRPGYIARTLAALGHTGCGVAAALLYTWVTPERDVSDREDWFGINPPGGGSTADTEAFAAGLREAATPRPRTRCSR